MAAAGGARTSKRRTWRRVSDSNDLHTAQGFLAALPLASRERLGFRPHLASQISRHRGHFRAVVEEGGGALPARWKRDLGLRHTARRVPCGGLRRRARIGRECPHLRGGRGRALG